MNRCILCDKSSVIGRSCNIVQCTWNLCTSCVSNYVQDTEADECLCLDMYTMLQSNASKFLIVLKSTDNIYIRVQDPDIKMHCVVS